MAKMFYSVQEAAKRLGKTEEEVRKLVHDGTLREFRDAGKVNYKVDDVEALAQKLGVGGSSGSTGGEIVLEPADDSGIELAPSSGSDVLSLEEVESSEDTSAGTTATGKKDKEGSVVPSVGVNVFDDDELDEAVDPLAQTAVTDVAGLGIDGSGSGSGIMNLSRESDDTSLGAELLEEIYGGEEESKGVEMGEDTRAGLEEAIPEADEEAVGETFQPSGGAAPASGRQAVTVVQAVEYAPDAVSTGLTAALFVAVIIMWFAGLAGAAMVRGVVPGIVRSIYDNLMIFAGVAFGASVVAGGIAFFIAKRGK